MRIDSVQYDDFFIQKLPAPSGNPICFLTYRGNAREMSTSEIQELIDFLTETKKDIVAGMLTS